MNILRKGVSITALSTKLDKDGSSQMFHASLIRPCCVQLYKSKFSGSVLSQPCYQRSFQLEKLSVYLGSSESIVFVLL